MQQVHTSRISTKETGHNANYIMIQQLKNHIHRQTLAISSFLGFTQILHLYFEIYQLLIRMCMLTPTEVCFIIVVFFYTIYPKNTSDHVAIDNF